MSFPIATGQVLAGKYRIERLLGQGGMGVVVEAWHLELEQKVAVKFLLAALAERPEAAERFRREAGSVARIKSEHVVRVLDVGTLDEGAPFMVMEFLEGRDLAHELEARGPLPVPEAVGYLLEAIEAVAGAHALGIVHRDLTPGNIFLTQCPDGSRTVKVLDFGISKAQATEPGQINLTQTSSMMGSPLYMSPEQMKSASRVDARTDIWSLGAILYQSLAGAPPHNAETLPDLCVAVLEREPRAISEFRPDVPQELQRVVLQCLEKDREKRFGSVAELALALAPFGDSRAQLHAERASRLLSTDPGLATRQALRAPTLSVDTGGVATQSPTAAPASSVAGSTNGRASSTGASTDPASGNAGETSASFGYTDTSPGRGRRRGILLILAALTLLAAGAVVFRGQLGAQVAASDGPADAQLAVESVTSALEPAAPPTHEVSASASAPATATPPEPPTPTVTPSPPPRVTRPVAARPPPATHRTTPPKPASPTTQPPTERPDAGASSGVRISDFGGRR